MRWYAYPRPCAAPAPSVREAHARPTRRLSARARALDVWGGVLDVRGWGEARRAERPQSTGTQARVRVHAGMGAGADGSHELRSHKTEAQHGDLLQVAPPAYCVRACSVEYATSTIAYRESLRSVVLVALRGSASILD